MAKKTKKTMAEKPQKIKQVVEVEEKKPQGVAVKDVGKFMLNGELYRKDRCTSDGKVVAVRLVKTGGWLMTGAAKILDPDTLVEEVK